MAQPVYLDNAATTSVSEGVADAVSASLRGCYGNPSSLYMLGLEARKSLDRSRAAVAKALGCAPEALYFTACGTESNNLALLGAARARRSWGDKVVVTGFEHPAVLNTVLSLHDEGFEVAVIQPHADGTVDAQEFLAAVDGRTVLAAAMRVNNEIGTLLDTPALARAVKQKNRRTAFHCDAVQSFLKHPTALDGGIDTLSVSAHKVHGPKGIGALYVRKGFHLKQVQFGGGQERGLRSGTENIAYAAGFAEAVREADDWKQRLAQVAALRDSLRASVEELGCAVVNSPRDASPYILNFSLMGFRSETVLHFLESRGVLVSSGSACGHGAKSHTLTAMGLSDARIDGSVRVSFCGESSEADVQAAAQALRAAAATLERK